MNAEGTYDPSDSEYRDHMRALEACAARLEDGELDPQEALDVYREAQQHYEAVDRMLAGVEEEVSRIRGKNGG